MFKKLFKKKKIKKSLLENAFDKIIHSGFQPTSIVDIGAHQGGWTEKSLLVFPDAEYSLFEPQEELCTIIRSKFIENNKVTLEQLGVAKTSGQLKFTLHERLDSRSFSISEAEAEQRGLKQVTLNVTSLDDYFKDKAKPNLLKIDAEGIDLDVLEGAKTILPHLEVIFIEASVMNQGYKNTLGLVINALAVHDFILFDFTDLNRTPKNGVLWLVECVFIKKNSILDRFFSSYE